MNRAFLSVLILGLAACGGGGTDGLPTNPSTPQGDLVVEDTRVGDGAVAESGDTVTVHYEGRFTDGTVFDSSYARNQPFVFTAGLGQVIAGWDQGVPGMRVGGLRRLTIPPHLAYGSVPPAGIPPNATLIFDVEMLSIAGK